jgi:hypothetical protein
MSLTPNRKTTFLQNTKPTEVIIERGNLDLPKPQFDFLKNYCQTHTSKGYKLTNSAILEALAILLQNPSEPFTPDNLLDKAITAATQRRDRQYFHSNVTAARKLPPSL